MTKREKYFSLLALVCEKLPYYAAQMAFDAEGGTLQRWNNVKQGKTVDLPALVTLIRISKPDFQIPEHLLPEVAAQEAIA